jgi:5-methylcytosine-specific restriction endonuclease McrA
MTRRLCQSCGKSIGFLKKFVGGDLRFCDACASETAGKLTRFRNLFLQATADGYLTAGEWQGALEFCQRNQLAVEAACQHIAPDALAYVERLFAFARADGEISDEEAAAIEWAVRALMLPPSAVGHIAKEIAYLRFLTDVRAGRLPHIQTTAATQAGEIPHYECPATYQRVLKASVRNEPGRLLATSKRLVFSAASGGWDIPYSKVVRVEWHLTGVYLELSRRSGNGLYFVEYPEVVATVIHTLVRINTRQLVTGGDVTRHIPHDIKVAVWNRDGGACVQCRATDYLEFDHIIPYSKGGANSVNNVQLLCRRCNLVKGDRL